jgi:hypothetical protein
LVVIKRTNQQEPENASKKRKTQDYEPRGKDGNTKNRVSRYFCQGKYERVVTQRESRIPSIISIGIAQRVAWKVPESVMKNTPFIAYTGISTR